MNAVAVPVRMRAVLRPVPSGCLGWSRRVHAGPGGTSLHPPYVPCTGAHNTRPHEPVTDVTTGPPPNAYQVEIRHQRPLFAYVIRPVAPIARTCQ